MCILEEISSDNMTAEAESLNLWFASAKKLYPFIWYEEVLSYVVFNIVRIYKDAYFISKLFCLVLKP